MLPLITLSRNGALDKIIWVKIQRHDVGLLTWFIIDGCVSLYYGAVHNIVMINIVALILIGIPLIMTRKDFQLK